MKTIIVCFVGLILAVAAIAPSHQETECQRKRRDAERQVAAQEKYKNNANLAIVIPNCDADGNYASLQCHYGSPFCQCWDKEGYPLTQPKKNLRKCNCMADRALALRKTRPSEVGESYLTECDQTGNYKPKQCDRKACWCVNPDTGKKLTSENRDKSAVTC